MKSSNADIVIPFTNREIKIDGNLKEWKTYYSVTFEDTLQKINTPGTYSIEQVYHNEFSEDQIPLPLSRNRVTARLCWDKNALYLGFIVDDRHFVAEFFGEKDNPQIFLNDGVEFYIDTKNDSKGRMDINDYHIIIDILNQQCILKGVLHLMKSDTLLVPQQPGQNIVIESAVNYVGTINHPKNGAQYVVEIKIPFLSIGMVPFEGKVIRIDLCANDSDYLLTELNTEKEDLRFTWGFNLSGLGDFGFPDTWKKATLTGKPSMYYLMVEKLKFSWVYIIGGLLLFGILIVSILTYKLNKLRKLPDVEIVHKIIIYNKAESDPSELNDINELLAGITKNIYQNVAEKITPQELADKYFISLRTLQRLTKKELDCTPVALINSVKLQYAKDVLQKNKGISISQVAYETGFSDPAYFSKLFKSHFGISPRNFVSGNEEYSSTNHK